MKKPNNQTNKTPEEKKDEKSHRRHISDANKPLMLTSNNLMSSVLTNDKKSTSEITPTRDPKDNEYIEEDSKTAGFLDESLKNKKKDMYNRSKTPPKLQQIDDTLESKKVMLCVKFKNEEIEKKIEEGKEKTLAISKLEQELNDRKDKITKIEEDLDLKQKNLETMMKEFEIKTKQYNEKETMFASVCQQMDVLDKDLTAKKKKNDELTKNLESKEKELAQKDELLTKKTYTYEDRIKELKEKEKEVLRINIEINTKTNDMTSLMRDLDKKKLENEKTLLKSKETLEREVKTLSTKHEDLEKKTKINSEKHKTVSDELKELEGDLRDARTELKNVERISDRKGKETEKKEKEVVVKREEMRVLNMELKHAQVSVKNVKPQLIKLRTRLLVHKIQLGRLWPVWRALVENKNECITKEKEAKIFVDQEQNVETENLKIEFTENILIQTTPLKQYHEIAVGDDEQEINEKQTLDNFAKGFTVLDDWFVTSKKTFSIFYYNYFFDWVKDIQNNDYQRFKVIKRLVNSLSEKSDETLRLLSYKRGLKK